MKRQRIEIRGIVQGVGFRPFVYHLALECGVTGYVLNTSEGVRIEAQGGEETVARFVHDLSAKAPPFAQIDRLDCTGIEPQTETGFVIRESVGEAGKLGLVLPDIATCADCFDDFTGATNRRFGYPFTNCTNCGPRYTIIEDLPYDRPNTTMRVFPMCEACRAEYEDPANRRFHAQPNACPACGPQLMLAENKSVRRAIPHAGERVSEAGDAAEGGRDARGPRAGETPALQPACAASDPGAWSAGILPAGPRANTRDSGTSSLRSLRLCVESAPRALDLIRQARELLRQGHVLAIKGLGGFHLACDATNDEAVRALRQRKKRSDKPFALMARDLAAVERFCLVPEDDRTALLSPLRPIVILARRPDAAGALISPEIAPGNRTLGVMLPYTPLHHLLFADLRETESPFTALVMTSGNLSEEPIVTDNDEAWQRLGGVADWFLFHNRGIYMRVDDSVVRTFEGAQMLIRRSRGFVPRPIDLGVPLGQVLACGAELKNTFCLTKDHYALVSQHIGDVENYETLVFFRETLENMKKLFRVTPEVAAHDLHPQYLSTRFALELEGIEKIGVQHHHAHIAACMAENHLSGKVIGVAFDGTGYGTDGRIWGGEFLVAGYEAFERRAHLAYVPLAGGDAAIRQPWRSALSHLLAAFPDGGSWAQLWPAVPEKSIAVVEAMIRRGIQTVDTSSCGRLFDAVAALIGLRHEVNFEGQAAIELENIAEEGVEECYPFEFAGAQPQQIDVRPMIRCIVGEVERGERPGRISAKFHNTIAAIVVDGCLGLRRSERLERVCLSGGTFQNFYLLSRAVAGLRRNAFEVFLHSKVPPNDGCISLGQAVIASARRRRAGD